MLQAAAEADALTLMEQFKRKSSAESSVTFIDRALSGLSLQRLPGQLGSWDDEDLQDAKGPLGLNLLYAPSEPMIDLIFVHGLGGGSRKTWSKLSNPYNYWPKEWLRRDPDFSNVRIHSFGYNADWGEKQDSMLDISDFSRSLLGELQDSPHIRQDETRIIFVGHSMGGLVIKKACVLAGEDPAFASLRKRFDSVYFLGTPHRGSDLARTLTNILKTMYGHKSYVNDLHRNSSMISGINDAFRHYATDLKLWSFYETLKTKLFMTDAIIVDKNSATLGYPHERVVPLNADHRGVCKFDGLEDPNYKILRNALSSTVATIISADFQAKKETPRDELRRLSSFIGIDEIPEDDLTTVGDVRVPGSCEWFLSKAEFNAWTTISSSSPSIMWLSGNPASGKSVLASYVVGHLEENNMDVSYFFFKHGVAGKSTVSDCLRSLAFQILLSSSEVRKRLLLLEKDGLSFDRNDEKAIWRKIFLGCIFPANTVRPQYWVIDALDECSKFQNLVSNISKLESFFPLRIFITSRKLHEIDIAFAGLGDGVQKLEIQAADTADDIKAYVTIKFPKLPVGDLQSRQRLTDRILQKSGGSFLWVRLVVQELEKTWSDEAVEDVLNSIPSDMNLFYARTLETMARDNGGLKLAKAMLTWTVCAARPLKLEELHCALKLDIKETIHNLERSIASVCGQLLFVDQTSTVHIIHPTARDFLLQPDLHSEFAVSRHEAHLRMALACLEVLSGNFFKGPRSQKQRPLVSSRASKDNRAFVGYACAHFSDHVFKASSSEQVLMDALYTFLNGNVLSWIENIAQTGKLHHIIRTARNLKSYLDRRENYYPPIGPQVQTVKSWILDLIRVSSKFQGPLISSPSSIYWLIPPMCPRSSIIARKFTSPHRGIAVRGVKSENWDDCLTQIDYPGSEPTAVAHGDRYFGVGQFDGTITIYYKVSCQIFATLNHQQKVKVLSFGTQDNVLASSSISVIRVWDLQSRSQLWELDTAHQALALTFQFDNSTLLVATQGNYLLNCELFNGGKTTKVFWHAGHDSHSQGLHQKLATHAVLSPDLSLVAVSCRGQPILLFDLESETFIGNLARHSESQPGGCAGRHYPVTAIVFNPSEDINLLVASYADGELVVYDLWSLEISQRLPNVNAQTMACSPDGRTLATGSAFGAIQIFDFDGAEGDNLTLIYRINAYEDGVKSLVFSDDSLRFVDIRGTQCRVWEPAVLVRKDLSDECSQSEMSDPAPLALTTVGMVEGEIKAEITAMVCHPDGQAVFCGRQDGSIVSFSTQDSLAACILYKHAANIPIIAVVIDCSQNILASVDQAGRIKVASLNNDQTKWTLAGILVDQRFSGAVIDLVLNAAHDRLLICGRESIEIWTIRGEIIGSLDFPAQAQKKAISHPLQPGHFIIFGNNVARIYSWADFKEIMDTTGAELNQTSAIINSLATISCHGTTTLAQLISMPLNRTPNQLFLFSTPTTTSPVSNLPGFANLGPQILQVISLVSTTLLVLSIDLWVCSLDIKSFPKTQQMTRHFFIPLDWRNSSGRMHFHLTSRNEFVFAKRDECVVVKRGLDFAETVVLGKGKV